MLKIGDVNATRLKIKERVAREEGILIQEWQKLFF
jgi:hypothetical protein